MKVKLSDSQLIKLARTGILLVIVVVPFHAFLAVWLASSIGHYTLLRLWKEFILLGLLIGGSIRLWRDRSLQQQLKQSRLAQLIGGYLLIQLVWGLVVYIRHTVTTKALAYGLLVNVRFLVFFLIVWLFASRTDYLRKCWRQVLIAPAILVICIALLQYFVLPYDVLKHFGYSASTIFPYETINNNTHYIRVMATLRGANPLGAYLVVVLSVLFAEWKRHLKEWQFAILPVAAGLALFLTFSRSAWIGAAASGLVVLSTLMTTPRALRAASFLGGSVLVLAVISFVAFRHTTTFENVFSHTQDHSQVVSTSNAGHRSALRLGVRDLAHEPLGRGPGSAGPASVYNNGKTRIAENYFVQLGQETGWLGLGFFIAIIVVVGKQLWQRRSDPLALGLCAALVGISLVSLLSHAWTDDTLAYVFWGLAGITIATPALIEKRLSRAAH